MVAVLQLPPRPWLELYGRHLRPPGATLQPDVTQEQVPLAPIQQLPDEVALLILGRLNPYALGRLACVCKPWRGLTQHPRLWELACQEAFQLMHPSREALQHVATSLHRRSWKSMFLHSPHLRFDGLYVSRNSYVRTGVREWATHRAVHVVVYFRYFRFFPDGMLLYKTSPVTVKHVAKAMAAPRAQYLCDDGRTAAPSAIQAHLFVGRYGIKASKVRCVVRYPNNRSTEIRCCMGLRSTTPGANNRLDVEALYSYDLELDRATALDGGGGTGGAGADAPLEPYAEYDSDAPPANGILHKRGLSACVFVPWEQAHTSVLNLPASQMDFFCPG